jgi:hypothetical protein
MVIMENSLHEAVGLTFHQEAILNEALHERYVLDTFYLTGGTALSAWYLNHRESHDLDFFTDKPIDYERVIRWVKHLEQTVNYSTVRFDQDYGFLQCYLRFSETISLKIDFHNYGAHTIKRGFQWRGLTIDSLHDITVNKLRTIATTPRTRDYVDLYCIYNFLPYSLPQLLADVRNKFRETPDFIQLARNFLKVEECTDMPIMRIPFDKVAMIKFYQTLTSTLNSSIFV